MLIDQHVPELSCGASSTRENLAARNDRSPNSTVQLEQDEIVCARGGAPHHLRQGSAVTFIVGKDRLFQRRLENAAQIDAGPTRQHGCTHDLPAGRKWS